MTADADLLLTAAVRIEMTPGLAGLLVLGFDRAFYRILIDSDAVLAEIIPGIHADDIILRQIDAYLSYVFRVDAEYFHVLEVVAEDRRRADVLTENERLV